MPEQLAFELHVVSQGGAVRSFEEGVDKYFGAGLAHRLTAQDVVSTSIINQATLSQIHTLQSEPLTSVSSITKGSIAQVHNMLSFGIVCISDIQNAVVGQTHSFLSQGVTTTSSVQTSDFAQYHNLVVDDLVSSSTIELSGFAQTHNMGANDLVASAYIQPPGMSAFLIKIPNMYILNRDDLKVVTDSETLTAEVIVKYGLNYENEEYRRYFDDGSLDDVLEIYNQRPRKTYETVLTTPAAAAQRAEYVRARFDRIRGIGEFTLMGKEFLKLRIYDIINIEVTPDELTQQRRPFYGTWRAKVISVAPDARQAINTITALLIEEVV